MYGEQDSKVLASNTMIFTTNQNLEITDYSKSVLKYLKLSEENEYILKNEFIGERFNMRMIISNLD